MKLLFFFIFMQCCILQSYAQKGCIDSSTHIQYSSTLNDSFFIKRIIQSQDGGKIYLGNVDQNKNNFGFQFGDDIILKTSKKGDIEWCKKFSFNENNSDAIVFDKIGEARNGNIFLLSKPLGISSRKYFVYTVLSSMGNIVYQKQVAFSNIGNIDGNPFLSLLMPLNADSMFITIFADETINRNQLRNNIITGTVANNGDIGAITTYQPTLSNFRSPIFNDAVFSNNTIELFGVSGFVNGCFSGRENQEAYVYVKIDAATKQIVTKKAFCRPPQGNGEGYFNSRNDPENFSGAVHNYYQQANGHTILTSTYVGLEYNGSDTVNRLFSISEFDGNFNHLKSEYINATNKFKRDCVYSLFIDSFNNRHIQIHDKPNNEIYYAVGNANNNYFLQKKMPFVTTEQNPFFTRQNFIEKDYLTSFNLISKNNNNSFIDNFKILSKDTAALCFGVNTQFLKSRTATVQPQNFVGDFNVKKLDVVTTDVNYIAEDYPMQANMVCNIVHKCDTIKIDAPDTVCNVIENPIIITVHKNPLCSSAINFIFDTTQVSKFSLVNDTTLYLYFINSYTGKIYAQLSGCIQLVDSALLVFIATPQPINLGTDAVICNNKSYTITAPNGYKNYEWQDGSTGKTFTTTTAGFYSITVADSCGRISRDTIQLQPQNNNVLQANYTSPLCINDTAILTLPNTFTKYEVQPNIGVKLQGNILKLSPQANTLYTIQANNSQGCNISDTLLITLMQCPEDIYFATAFTPNNDGVNDYFKALSQGNKPTFFELIIYNRFGLPIFKTNNINAGWNGQLNGNPQNPGGYVYICQYHFKNKPTSVLKGSFLLVR